MYLLFQCIVKPGVYGAITPSARSHTTVISHADGSATVIAGILSLLRRFVEEYIGRLFAAESCMSASTLEIEACCWDGGLWARIRHNNVEVSCSTQRLSKGYQYKTNTTDHRRRGPTC